MGLCMDADEFVDPTKYSEYCPISFTLPHVLHFLEYGRVRNCTGTKGLLGVLQYYGSTVLRFYGGQRCTSMHTVHALLL